MTERFHEMWAVVVNRWYRCSRCGYEGTLTDAVSHAVANQVPA